MVSTRSSMRRQSARLERKRELVSEEPIAKKQKIEPQPIEDTKPTEDTTHNMDSVTANKTPFADSDDSESDYDDLPSFNYVPKYVDMDMGDQLLDLDVLTDDLSVLDEQFEETDNTDVSDEEIKQLPVVTAPIDKSDVAAAVAAVVAPEAAAVCSGADKELNMNTDFMDIFATDNTHDADPVTPTSATAADDCCERWPMVDKNEHLSSFSTLNAFIPMPVESVPVSPVQPMAHVAPQVPHQMPHQMPQHMMQPMFHQTPSLDINDIVDSSACSDSDSVSASDSALWTERYNSIPICGFRNSLQRDDSYQSFVKSSMTKSKKRAAHFVVPGINKRSFLSGRAQAMLL
ncbi:hypothetical protein CJU90_1011 [Yarrowia sp. C11]|nr:hypothetical protein CKK34_2424 [Yarrowia sp. E02]KAG5373318.1 hypothetical protein CJU90_1011 [Yarrowia sp. C11]